MLSTTSAYHFRATCSPISCAAAPSQREGVCTGEPRGGFVGAHSILRPSSGAWFCYAFCQTCRSATCEAQYASDRGVRLICGRSTSGKLHVVSHICVYLFPAVALMSRHGDRCVVVLVVVSSRDFLCCCIGGVVTRFPTGLSVFVCFHSRGTFHRHCLLLVDSRTASC